MNGAKHTPGPWFQINGGKCVGGPESTPGLGHGIAACSMRARSEDESQANARLIAAAPDLLEALHLCLIRDPSLKANAMVMEALAKAGA